MIYNSINLMLPTFHRIDKLTRFITSAQRQSSGKEYICFTFYVNINDPDTVLLIEKLCNGWNYDILYESMEKPNLAKFYNTMYEKTKFQALETIVTMFGDDHEFVTKGYDKLFIEKINLHNGIGIFFGNDKKQKRSMPTMILATRKFIDYNRPEPFMNEKFPCDVIDRIWRDVAVQLNCLYECREIVIIHHHSKKDRDSTYLRLREVYHISKQNEKYVPEIVKSQIERMRPKINLLKTTEIVQEVIENVIKKTVITPIKKHKVLINQYKKIILPKTQNLKKIIPVTISTNKTVLFALMGRHGDIILGSFIANMLIDKGYQVTWLTIPHYRNLVKIVCERAEVLSIDTNADWECISKQEMRIKNFGYKYYINAQLGSKEHHNNFMASNNSPSEYVKNIVEKEIGEKLSDDFLSYARLKSLKKININRNKPLAIIAPETSSVISAITKEIIEEVYNKYKKDYHVKILVENPNPSDNRYIYGYTFIECLSLLQQTALFIGNDSGLAWASLYNPQCRKIIYHVKKRVEKTNISYNELDSNAEDIIIDISHTKKEEIEHKKGRKIWLLSTQADA